jgi:S1-C subfamily serine protease
VWELATWELLGEIKLSGRNAIGAAELSPDGMWVVALSDEQPQMHRVFLAVQDLVEFAKGVVPRCLSQKLRDQFFLEYDPPIWCFDSHKWPYANVRFGFTYDEIKGGERSPSTTGEVPQVYVTGVYRELPAGRAGMEVNDGIVSVDQRKIESVSDLSNVLASVEATQTAKVTVARNGKFRELAIRPRF